MVVPPYSAFGTDGDRLRRHTPTMHAACYHAQKLHPKTIVLVSKNIRLHFFNLTAHGRSECPIRAPCFKAPIKRSYNPQLPLIPSPISLGHGQNDSSDTNLISDSIIPRPSLLYRFRLLYCLRNSAPHAENRLQSTLPK